MHVCEMNIGTLVCQIYVSYQEPINFGGCDLLNIYRAPIPDSYDNATVYSLVMCREAVKLTVIVLKQCMKLLHGQGV